MPKMDEVYRYENVVLKRNGEYYELKTTSEMASIRKNKQTFNSFSFSINWANYTSNLASAYAGVFFSLNFRGIRIMVERVYLKGCFQC